MSTSESDRDVSRPRATPPIRPTMLALAMLIGLALAFGASPARASGCHLDERPVLGSNPSGHVAAWQMTDDRPAPPPVLARVPCPGETPHPPAVVVVAPGAACSTPRASIVEGSSRPILPAEDAASPAPHPLRLDRPPESGRFRRSGFPA